MEAPEHGMNYKKKRSQTEKNNNHNHDLSITGFKLLELLYVEP